MAMPVPLVIQGVKKGQGSKGGEEVVDARMGREPREIPQ